MIFFLKNFFFRDTFILRRKKLGTLKSGFPIFLAPVLPFCKAITEDNPFAMHPTACLFFN